MKSRIFNLVAFLIGLTALFQSSTANAAPWSVSPHDYRYDMSLYLKFTLSGSEMNYSNYTFGAFINGECRGIGEILNQSGMDSPVIYMRVYGNDITGGDITFQAYNETDGNILSSPSDLQFAADERIGMPSSPYAFNFIIPVTGVTLSASSNQILIGATTTVTASVTPGNASDKSLIWTSSNSQIASVNNGTVTGVGVGEAVITATANNGVYGTVKISVLPIECESVTLDKTQIEGMKGSSVQLSATVMPANTTDKTLVWTSSNVNIADVSNSGLVSLKNIGEAVITVTCGNKSAQCNVTVTAPLPESVSLSPSSLTLEPSGTANLSVSFSPSDAQTASLTWTSADPKVATVNGNGVVTAVGVGQTTITVTTAEGKSATASVTVKEPVIVVTSVTVAPTTGEIFIGSTLTLTATVAPDNATDKGVTWKSSNTQIATVDNKGVVTGVSAGTVTITATSVNGIQGTASVKVNNIECTLITLNQTSYSGKPGATLQLTATILPENTTVKTVTWSSSDNNIVTVSNNGLVTLKNMGTATVTAKCGNQTASCSITVTAPDVESVTVAPVTAILEPGKTVQLTATLQPANAVTASLTWKSSDAKVATVSDKGLVTAVAIGSATITVTTAEGKSATCQVTVRASVIEVTKVTLSPASSEVNVGSSVTLKADITPADATDKSITWTTSNSKIATVASGVVTGVAPGEVTITATANNGVKATATIKVLAVECSSIKLNQSEFTGYPGETVQLTATIAPENTTDKTVTWTSSNNNIATVNDKGFVVLIAPGEATITAAANNGVKATAAIKVKAIECSSIKLNQNEITGKPGETVQLTATIAPENTTDKTVTWTSSDSNVATVNDNGLVSLKATGKATITAKCGSQTATCEVNVLTSVIEVEEVNIVPTEVVIMVGESYELTAEVLPENASDMTLVWTSEDEEIATVEEGLVTAVAEGEVIIKATAVNGVTGECKVTCREDAGVESLFMDNSEVTVYSLDGTIIRKNVKVETLNELAKGIYIIKSKSKTVKLIR